MSTSVLIINISSLLASILGIKFIKSLALSVHQRLACLKEYLFRSSTT